MFYDGGMISFKKVEKKKLSDLSSHFFMNLNHSIKSMSSLLLLAKIILGQWSSKKKAWTVIISSTLNLLGRRIIINNNTTSVSSKWHKKQIWWVFFIYQYLDLEKQLRPKMTRQKWYAPREKSVSKKLWVSKLQNNITWSFQVWSKDRLKVLQR